MPKAGAPATTQFGAALLTQLGELLGQALTNAATLEVRTFTSEASDAGLVAADDPLVEDVRLRAFTRVAIDGDTQQCLPLLANGEPDTTLWGLHNQAVDQARKDRAASIEATIALLERLAKR